MLREKLSSSNGRFCLSRLKPISSYFTKKKRLLLISFRGFLCRKLPLFQASFFLDFIFVSLFPILYLFLLLLCLTRGFSSSAVDCIFFFKVFYQLHFCPFFFLTALLSSPFFANPKKKKLFLLSEVYFFLAVSSHLHLYVIRGRSSNYPKQSKTARASSFTFFFFSLRSSPLILSLNLFVAVNYSLSPSLCLFSLFTFLFCLQTAHLVHRYMCILYSL